MSYLEFAEMMAREAGAIIKANFTLGMEREWKQDGTPLTVTDSAINELVISRVAHQFPLHRVLGEEDSSSDKIAEFTWVCDPVDGTIPFSRGIPISVFSLALCHHGVPIVGVIFDSFSNRLLIAEKGKGARLNGKPVHVSKDTSLQHAAVGVDGPPIGLFEIERAMSAISRYEAHVFTLRCICFTGMLVALGEFAGTVFNAKTPWDGAALAVIIAEAGGKMTDIDGNDQLYDRPTNGFVASNGLVHDKLIAAVSTARAARTS